jgi:glycerol-3-phosphate O-acyltransferase
MKEELYKKMEQMFPLIEHRYQEVGPMELTICRLARGNTFNMRVVGLEAVKRLRRENPDCAITFKPNHFSEADFMLLAMLFLENGMRVVTEGGDNLFLEHIDVFGDLLPLFVHPGFKDDKKGPPLSLADYLSSRGAFKVFREPQTLTLPDGEEVAIGRKDILTLSQAYRCHLVRQKEMYITFPGYSSVKSGFMGLIKKDSTKTGRSYTGRFDGFHHLPFQMDIDASLATGVDVYIVPVNIAYSPVLEDELFLELLRLKEAGTEKNKIYLKDLGHVVESFCRDKRKGELSIKFWEPIKIDTPGPKDPFLSLKKKNSAKSLARSTFQKSLAMQPVFPANIYFSAFDEEFSRISIDRMRERIDDLRDRLRHLSWGNKKWRVDLSYVLDYRNHIISADEIINRTFELFSTPDRRITARDGDRFVIYNHHAAMQYRNHIAHFFEDDEKDAKEKSK